MTGGARIELGEHLEVAFVGFERPGVDATRRVFVDCAFEDCRLSID